jgi:hypothetical protein
MKNRAIILLSIISFFSLPFSATAQDYNISCLSYQFSETLPTFTPDSTDKSYSMVIVKAVRINEFRYDLVKKSFDFYYCNHNVKYLNDNKAVEDNNKFYASVGENNSFLGINIRVIDKGKVVFEATEKDFIEVEEEGRKYNMIAIKGLDKGMLLETVTKTKYADFEVYDDEYMQYDNPVKQAEFYLISPENLVFKCKSYNGYAEIKDSVVNERHVYYGKQNNIPAVNMDEKYSFINANKMRIEFNFHLNNDSKKYNAKWPELGRTFFDRMNYNYDKNVKDIQKILSKVNWKEAKSNADKVFLIENYLKMNITIDKNVEDKPTMAESLKAHAATPFRFNQIMAQCFRYTGTNVEYILTSKRPYKKFDPNFDSWSFLNNVLFYEPESKKFIDPQEPLKRMGYINTDYLGQHGLFVKIVQIGDAVSASATVKLIPANDGLKSTDYENYSLRFNANADKVIFTYDRTMNEYAEQGLKGLYYVMDDNNRKEVMEGFVKGMAKESTIDSFQILNFDPTVFENLDKPLVIKATLTTDDFIESTGANSFLFKIGEVIGQQSEMYQEKQRLTSADIDFAHAYKRVITLHIPEGYKLKGLDKLNMNFTFKNSETNNNFGFTSTYKVEGNKLYVYCDEYYNDLHYPVTDFNAFKQVINAAADFNKISILLEK